MTADDEFRRDQALYRVLTGASAAPSEFYRQHHALEAPKVDARTFRQGWRRITRIDTLLVERAITARQWHACADFRELVERARRGGLIRSSIAEPERVAGRQPDWTPGDLDAIAELQLIRAALGRFACALLEWAIADEEPYAALGRRFDVDPKTARAWVIALIRALADAA